MPWASESPMTTTEPARPLPLTVGTAVPWATAVGAGGVTVIAGNGVARGCGRFAPRGRGVAGGSAAPPPPAFSFPGGAVMRAEAALAGELLGPGVGTAGV